jgi:hypothetical protein
LQTDINVLEKHIASNFSPEYGSKDEISSHGGQSCTSELERDEGGSEEQSSVAVCGGCPMLQIGVTGIID